MNSVNFNSVVVADEDIAEVADGSMSFLSFATTK